MTLGNKVLSYIVQYSLHHVTYSGTTFEVARSTCLGGDTFRRNVTDTSMHRRTDRQTLVRYKYALFSKEKMGIKKNCVYFMLMVFS